MPEDRLIAALLAIGAQLTREGARLMAPLGLSRQESIVLIRIAEQEDVSQRALRSELLLERSNVSKAVAHLTSLGLVETRTHPTDRRSTLLSVTPSGRTTAETCMQVYSDWNRRWLSGVDPHTLATTVTALEGIMRATSNESRHHVD